MAGVYVGESLPPVPPKLASKILRWEYIEMAEMLPEFWSGAKLEEEDSKRLPPLPPSTGDRHIYMDSLLHIVCQRAG